MKKDFFIIIFLLLVFNTYCKSVSIGTMCDIRISNNADYDGTCGEGITNPMVNNANIASLNVPFSGPRNITSSNGSDGCEMATNQVDVTAETPSVFLCVGDLATPGLPPLANIDCPFKYIGWVDGNVGGVQVGNSIKWTQPGIFQAYTVHGPCNGQDRYDYGDVVQVFSLPSSPSISDVSVDYSSDCSNATLTYTGSSDIEWSNGSSSNSITVSAGSSGWINLVNENGCKSPSVEIPVPVPTAGTLSGEKTSLLNVTTTLQVNGNSNGIKRWEYFENGTGPIIINNTNTSLNVSFSTNGSTSITRTYYAVIYGPGGCDKATNHVDVTAEAPSVFLCIGDIARPGLPPLSNIDCPFVRLGWVGNYGGVQEGNSIRWTQLGIFQAYTVHGPCNGQDRYDYGDVVQVFEVLTPILGNEVITEYDDQCSSVILEYLGDEDIIWSTGETTSSIEVNSTGTITVRKVNPACEGPSYSIDVSLAENPITSITKTNLSCGSIELSYPVVDMPDYGAWFWQESTEGTEEDTYRISNTIVVYETGTYYLRHHLSCGWSDPLTINVTESDLNQNCNPHPSIIEYSNKKEDLSPLSISLSTSKDYVSTSVTYYDGLGRDLQIVKKEQTRTAKDIVIPIRYDELGRQNKNYLPYVSGGQDGSYNDNALNEDYTLSDHYNFYVNSSGFNEQKAFSEICFENSPLSRVIEQGSPGSVWQPGEGATVRYKYGANKVGDKVYQWSINGSNGRPTTGNNYVQVEVYKNVTIDESENMVIEFVDKLGQTVLKRVQAIDDPDLETYIIGEWADTYYVYDDFGNLRYVLPPAIIIEIGEISLSLTISEDQINTWAFQYKYDDRNRMTEKRVPGSDWVYMIYDDRDRLVLSQDGNQRLENKFTFTKYDALNRPVMTGEKVINNSVANLRDLLNGPDWLENYAAYETMDGDKFGYTSNSLPKNLSLDEIYTVTYYDNYDFKNLADFNNIVYNYDATQLTSATCDQGIYGFEEEEFPSVKGQVTGSQTKVLDGTDSKWLKAVTYYDDKYRVIQTVMDNYEEGIDRVSNIYNFPGWLLETYTGHTTGSSTEIGIKRRYVYDHAGRLMKGYHRIKENGNWQDEVLLAANHYNELGELIEKGLHVENNVPGQSVDYRYNIRGWLKSINNSTLTQDTEEPNPDYFGMELLYNSPLNGVAPGN